MSMDIRSFHIRAGSEAEEDERRLSAFLRTVDVKRIETAFADGWRVLVMYEDRRRQEENLQIASAIQSALNIWRDEVARSSGVARQAVLGDELIFDIARLAPTTEIELTGISPLFKQDLSRFRADIVRVVKTTLNELVDVDEPAA